MYGAMRIQRPINGLLSVVDQSRCGILLYTDDGLYVDTLFPDGRRFNAKTAGIYPQPGEFFAGQVVPNRDNGRIYLAMGKYTPLLYEVEGWSLRENPVRRIENVQRSVTIAASQIASPPEIALSLRGGAGAAKFARFSPGLGEPAFDGSLAGWESCEPVTFQAENDSTRGSALPVPARSPAAALARAARHAVHGQAAAAARARVHARPAGRHAVLLHPKRHGREARRRSRRPARRRAVRLRHFPGRCRRAEAGRRGPVRRMARPRHGEPAGLSHAGRRSEVRAVGAVEGAQLAHRVDADGQGFVLVAAIPRTALPRLTEPFAGGFRTLVNFEATFGGHNKIWWANSDGSASRETYDEPTEARLYPGSWAPAEFTGLDRGIVVRHWLLAGPFGGPGAEQFQADPNGVIAGTTIEMKKAVREFCEAARYPLDDAQVDLEAVFTGDLIRGYWPDPTRVTWKPASIEPLDTRVICGGGGQVWYGATWIHAPGGRGAGRGVSQPPDDRAALDVEWRAHPADIVGVSSRGEWPGPHRDSTHRTSRRLERASFPRLLLRLPALPCRPRVESCRGKTLAAETICDAARDGREASLIPNATPCFTPSLHTGRRAAGVSPPVFRMPAVERGVGQITFGENR